MTAAAETINQTPWLSEPSSLDFLDDATGLACAMRRGPVGHWCGYVGIPEGHRLYGMDYNAPINAPEGWHDRTTAMGEDYSPISLFCASVTANPSEGIYPLDLMLRCHGGLNYADKSITLHDAKNMWWLGFDCAHSGDLCPGGSFHSDAVYRDEQYVRASLAKLCADIAALSRATVQS